jgi:hypothetical protein
MSMSKLYVPLTDDEFVKLAQVANQEHRHPRDQAQIIIHSVLFDKSSLHTTSEPSTDKQPKPPKIEIINWLLDLMALNIMYEIHNTDCKADDYQVLIANMREIADEIESVISKRTGRP